MFRHRPAQFLHVDVKAWLYPNKSERAALALFPPEQGRRVDVANRATEHGADLMDDLVTVLYSFAARMYGKRGSRARAHSAATTLGESHG